MENKSAGDTSPVMIIAGLVAIIVITLGVLGAFAMRQAPTEATSAGNDTNTAAVAEAATPTDATATMTETTTTVVTDTAATVVTDTASVTTTDTVTGSVVTTGTTAVSDTVATAMTATVATAVTGTTTAAVTTTAPAVVTTTAAVSSTGAPVTTTAPVSAAPAPVDMAAVTAAVTKGTCGACHTIAGLDIAVGAIGPNLSTIGADGATRIPGYTAEAYIRESILNPNAFIAPKCPAGDCVPGLMLPNLADILTPAEIDTIVNYLVTLKGQ